MLRTGVTLLAAVAAVAVAGAAAAQTQGVSRAEVVIGSHQPLSGPVADWGTSVANGLRMRIDEVNEAGGVQGRKIKLIVEDNQYNPARAAQVGNKLLKRDKVFALLGALGTPPNMVVMKEAFESGVPNLFPFTAARAMYQPFHKLKFAIFAPYYDHVRAGVKWMVDNKGKKKVCVMYQDNDYGVEVFEGARDQAKAMGVLGEVTTHKTDTQDFAAQIQKLRGANCDLVVLGSIVRDAIFPVATARKLGWNVDFLVSAASVTTETIVAAQGATEGLYGMALFPVHYEDSTTAEIGSWMKRYKAKFGKEPTIQAMGGYTAADLFVAALDRAGKSPTVDGLIAALEGLDNWRDNFGGPAIDFSAQNRLGTNKSYMVQVQKGRWVKLTDTLIY
jgi:branched-chain amino acid transport system substrate-binding protein